MEKEVDSDDDSDELKEDDYYWCEEEDCWKPNESEDGTVCHWPIGQSRIY